MNTEQYIRSYISEVIHFSLATTRDNIPWITEVHFSYDTDLNFYFRSKPHRRHSEDIKLNPNIAGNIIKQHHIGEKVRGVYFEGIAELLTDIHDNHIAYLTYRERFGGDVSMIEESFLENEHKFYKLSITKFYLFDNQENEPSIKLELSWKDISSI